ncbi:MAG TPA: hypothetical protein VLB29_11975 [Nocardioidaceae bacterium]|nr:hypothetical protein [Nocardioidaceae bacterium]
MANQRRRGRPPGLVTDLTPVDSLALDSDLRIGWLLRSWRLSLAPESNARSFAVTLTNVGRSADASRVSRWETGRLPVPFDLIAAYEEALGLPRGALVALAMTTRKLSRPSAELKDVLDPRHVDVHRFQEALDVALDGRPSGGDWLDIASYVATHADHTVLPTAVWRDLVGRLVHELGISVGAAYATRNQAALLLSLHHRAGREIVACVGQRVTGSESRIVADAILLLHHTEDPRAGDLVIRLLDHADEAIRNAAIFVAGAKLSSGHFDSDQLAALERTVVTLAHRRGLGVGGLFGGLTDLVELLPAEAADRVRRGASVPAGPRPRPPAQATQARVVFARVARAVARPDDQPEEPMLERLVEEVLTHKVAERRLQAALSIAMSPYRTQVAGGAARLLHDGPEVDSALQNRLVMLLTVVATEAERGLLRDLAEDRSSPHHRGALVALAHIPPSGVPEPVDLWPLDSPDEVDPETLRVAVYNAGMTGHPVLARLADDPRQEDWVRVAARWWLREGPAIHEPAPLL